MELAKYYRLDLSRVEKKEVMSKAISLTGLISGRLVRSNTEFTPYLERPCVQDYLCDQNVGMQANVCSPSHEVAMEEDAYEAGGPSCNDHPSLPSAYEY